MSRSLANTIAVSFVAFAAFLPVGPASADGGPVIVIPSRPGVPIIINGRDVSYAVVQGDWGLSRPGAVPVTVIGPAPYVRFRRETQRNYPRYGAAPERGRHEIEPPADRLLPEPAESFSRSWSTQSDVSTPHHKPRQETRYEPEPREKPYYDPDPRERSQSYNSGTDVVPATINDPQAFNPPIIAVPQIRGRRP